MAIADLARGRGDRGVARDVDLGERDATVPTVMLRRNCSIAARPRAASRDPSSTNVSSCSSRIAVTIANPMPFVRARDQDSSHRAFHVSPRPGSDGSVKARRRPDRFTSLADSCRPWRSRAVLQKNAYQLAPQLVHALWPRPAHALAQCGDRSAHVTHPTSAALSFAASLCYGDAVADLSASAPAGAEGDSPMQPSAVSISALWVLFVALGYGCAAEIAAGDPSPIRRDARCAVSRERRRRRSIPAATTSSGKCRDGDVEAVQEVQRALRECGSA